jgi:hypothetical protein
MCQTGEAVREFSPTGSSTTQQCQIGLDNQREESSSVPVSTQHGADAFKLLLATPLTKRYRPPSKTF